MKKLYVIATLLGLFLGVFFSATGTPMLDAENGHTEATLKYTPFIKDISTCKPASWNWNFGDGSCFSTQDPVPAFPSPGTYDITLNVLNGVCADSITKPIEFGFVC